MTGKLDELNKMAGVIGGFLLAEDGKVVVSELPDEYQKVNLTEVITPIRGFFKKVLSAEERLIILDFLCSEGRIVIRKDGNMFLGALCKPQVNQSLLRLSFNVQLTNIKKDKSLMKHFK